MLRSYLNLSLRLRFSKTIVSYKAFNFIFYFRSIVSDVADVDIPLIERIIWVTITYRTVEVR